MKNSSETNNNISIIEQIKIKYNIYTKWIIRKINNHFGNPFAYTSQVTLRPFLAPFGIYIYILFFVLFIGILWHIIISTFFFKLSDILNPIKTVETLAYILRLVDFIFPANGYIFTAIASTLLMLSTNLLNSRGKKSKITPYKEVADSFIRGSRAIIIFISLMFFIRFIFFALSYAIKDKEKNIVPPEFDSCIFQHIPSNEESLYSLLMSYIFLVFVGYSVIPSSVMKSRIKRNLLSSIRYEYNDLTDKNQKFSKAYKDILKSFLDKNIITYNEFTSTDITPHIFENPGYFSWRLLFRPYLTAILAYSSLGMVFIFIYGIPNINIYSTDIYKYLYYILFFVIFISIGFIVYWVSPKVDAWITVKGDKETLFFRIRRLNFIRWSFAAFRIAISCFTVCIIIIIYNNQLSIHDPINRDGNFCLPILFSIVNSIINEILYWHKLRKVKKIIYNKMDIADKNVSFKDILFVGSMLYHRGEAQILYRNLLNVEGFFDDFPLKSQQDSIFKNKFNLLYNKMYKEYDSLEKDKDLGKDTYTIDYEYNILTESTRQKNIINENMFIGSKNNLLPPE